MVAAGLGLIVPPPAVHETAGCVASTAPNESRTVAVKLCVPPCGNEALVGEMVMVEANWMGERSVPAIAASPLVMVAAAPGLHATDRLSPPLPSFIRASMK